MSLFLRRFALSVLILITGSVELFCFQPDLAAWDATGVRAGDFAPGKLDQHYLKHGYQFGNITEDQYLEGARALLDAPAGEDILERVRYNGDIEHFKLSTGEFAVMTKRGRIRTYFKTDYGYWMKRDLEYTKGAI